MRKIVKNLIRPAKHAPVWSWAGGGNPVDSKTPYKELIYRLDSRPLPTACRGMLRGNDGWGMRKTYCPSGWFLLLAFIAAGCIAQAQFKTGSLSIATKFGDLNYRIEVADTNRLKSIGLMYRSSMPEGQGMLLLNEKPQRMNIWMKNTFIPLDIIYIDSNGHIVKIVENARTESTTVMPSDGKVKAVLELNAGQVRQKNIAVGDSVTYQVD